LEEIIMSIEERVTRLEKKLEKLLLALEHSQLGLKLIEAAED